MALMTSAPTLALISILLWSMLAALGTLLVHVPPFLLVGLALLIGSTPGLGRWREFSRNPRTLLLGTTALFGYHFCLFLAFRLAPAVEANLINYLWPVLIVLLSPLFLKSSTLRWYHVAGAVTAFAGAALVATGGHLSVELTHIPGLLLALAAALIWSSYSVLTKRLPPFSTATVSVFCFGAGVLSLLAHWLLEPHASLRGQDWILLLFLGLGPMGAAFYTWDAALKRGDPRMIGALCYLTPLLSTLGLILVGQGHLTAVAAVAMALIITGALLGSGDLLTDSFSNRAGRSALD